MFCHFSSQERNSSVNVARNRALTQISLFLVLFLRRRKRDSVISVYVLQPPSSLIMIRIMACFSASQGIRSSRPLLVKGRVLSGHCNRLNNLWKRDKSTASVTALKGKQEASDSDNLVSHRTEYHNHPKDKLDLTFSNTKDAYKSKTTSELIRALLVLKLSSYDILINNHARVRKMSLKIGCKES